MDIQWKRGEFIKFFARMKIRVGGKEEHTIIEGDEFEYDGTICRYGGAEIASSSLRGAVRQNWVTTEPVEDDRSPLPAAYNPPRAVAKSQTKNTDLNRVQRTPARHMATENLDEETVLDVGDRRPLPRDSRGMMDHMQRAPAHHLTKADNRKMAFSAPKNPTAGQRVDGVQMSEFDQQDGRTVARLRSPTNVKIDILKNPGATRDIENRKVEDGFGSAYSHSRGIDPSSHVYHQEGVDISMNVGNVDRSQVYDGDEEDGQIVGRVRHTDRNLSREGVHVSDTSNIRQQRANGHRRSAPSRASQLAKTAKAAAKPAAKIAKPATQPKAVAPVPIDTKLPPKIRMARRIDPTFPAKWSFEGKLAERLEAVRKHGASPEFLEALYAAEGDQMRKVLEKEFPQQFGG